MPHLRKRHAETLIREKLMSHSALVGVIGHRQVGKTTLLEELCDSYHSLDDEDCKAKVDSSAKAFVKSVAGERVAIDEAQLSTALFPALKEWVRVHKKPGQFILSGSVRFTSRQAIRESLTGRISMQELLPLTLSEILERPLPSFFQDLVKVRDFTRWAPPVRIPAREAAGISKAIETYLTHGGLPGACFIRDERLRARRLDEQLETILTRDIRQVVKTPLTYPEIRAVAEAMAAGQGHPIEFSELQRRTRVSRPTLRKLLFAFEALFLVRLLPVEGDRAGLVCHWEDLAEGNRLAQGRLDRDILFEQLVVHHARAEWMYRLGRDVKFFHFLTRGGSRVALGIRTPEGTLGIIPQTLGGGGDGEIPRQARAWAQSFLKTYMDSKIAFVHDGRELTVLGPRMIAAPAQMIV